MKKYLSIGSHYVSDFIKNDTEYKREKYSLDLYLDEQTGALRLNEIAPHDSMWGTYWYRSGINESMPLELKSIVDQTVKRIKHNLGDIWLDIACNDGTMFKFIPDSFTKLGIDPSDDSYYSESSKLATVVQDYFSYEAYNKTGCGDRKCKVITSIAMFYDLENPHIFIEDICKVLDDNGVWVMQLSYTPLMLKQMAFDNICHEHVYYYSLKSLKNLFEQHDLKIVDAEINDTNGGSVRVYIQKNIASLSSFGTAHLRDVCDFKINSLLEYETNHYDITSENAWKIFSEKLNDLKTQTVEFIRKEKALGKKIYGYGASTKGNTLLQFYGLNHNDIDAIAERSSYKFGLKTAGSNIPIVSESEMRDAKPDYLLILPWCFVSEFLQREKKFLESGGKFIVPCPDFQIIGL
jgi:hypothetical protein